MRWLVVAACAAVGCGGRSNRERSAAAAPVVVIEAETSGLAIDEVERLVVLPTEHALAGSPDLGSISAVSTASRAVLTVELAPNANVWRVRSMISESLSRAALPNDVEPYLLPPTGEGSEHYVLRSDRATPAEVRSIQDWWLRYELLSVKGVVDVGSCGGAVAVVEIAVHPERLQALDVSLNDVTSALPQAIDSAGSGLVEQGGGRDFVIRGVGRPMDDLDTVRLRLGVDHVPVALRDVAEVRRIERPASCQVVLGDGSAAVTGRVRFGSPATRDELMARLEALQPAMPPGARVERFGRWGDPAGTLHVRIASVPGEDAEMLQQLAEGVARTAANADGVLRVMAEVGDEPGFTDRLPGEIDVLIELAPDVPAAKAASQIMERVRTLPGITARRPTTSTRLLLELTGPDREALAATAAELRRVVADVDGVEVAVTLGTATAPRRSISLDRGRMAAVGVAPRDVSDAVRMATDGLPIGQSIDGDRALSIEMRWAEIGRDPQQLARIPLRTSSGAWVVLQDVASIAVDEPLAALLRKGGAPSMSVWIEFEAAAADRIKREIRQRIADVPLSPSQLLTLR